MSKNEVSCTFVLAARPQSAGVARARTRAWLEAIRCPQPIGDDIVYAVNEAVSNAIEHAYPIPPPTGTVRLTLRALHNPAGNRRIRAEIRDHGRWRPPPADPEGRGRGIPLMQALMAEFVVHQLDVRDGAGTEVIMTSAEIPLMSR